MNPNASEELWMTKDCEDEQTNTTSPTNTPAYTAALLKWLTSTIGTEVVLQNADANEYLIRCSLCQPKRYQERTVGVNPAKNSRGVFICHNCGDHGTLFDLVCEAQAHDPLAGRRQLRESDAEGHRRRERTPSGAGTRRPEGDDHDAMTTRPRSAAALGCPQPSTKLKTKDGTHYDIIRT
jgi:hypothetical protein